MSSITVYGATAPGLAPERLRPTRADLLDLLAGGGRASLKTASICQSHCSHCYAGHCGSGCGSNIGDSGPRPH